MKKSNNSLIFSRVLMPAMALVFTLSTQAEIYKWTDENGKVHYSDKPFDEKSEKVKVGREPTSAERLEAQKRASQMIQRQNKVHSINDQKAREQKLSDQKEEKERKKRAAACAEAKRLIIVYSGRGAVYTKDKNGIKNYKGYTDEQKNQKIAEQQKIIKNNCNG